MLRGEMWWPAATIGGWELTTTVLCKLGLGEDELGRGLATTAFKLCEQQRLRTGFEDPSKQRRACPAMPEVFFALQWPRPMLRSEDPGLRRGRGDATGERAGERECATGTALATTAVAEARAHLAMLLASVDNSGPCGTVSNRREPSRGSSESRLDDRTVEAVPRGATESDRDCNEADREEVEWSRQGVTDRLGAVDEGLARAVCGTRRSLGCLLAIGSMRFSARRRRQGLATACVAPTPGAPTSRLPEEHPTLLAAPSLKMQSLARSSSCIRARRATASCLAASPWLWPMPARLGGDHVGGTTARGVSK